MAVSIVFAKDFSDLDSTHWAYSYVSDLTEKNVISGYEDGTYRPNGTLTRAEFFKLVACTDESILASGELLISGEQLELNNWYDKYFYSVDLMGLNPYIYQSGDLELPITRVEMAGILDEFAKFEGLIEFQYDFITDDQDEIIKNAIAKYAQELGYIKNKNITKDNFDEEVYSKLDEVQLNTIMEKVNEEIDISDWGENKEYVPLFEDTADNNKLDIVSINHMRTLGIIKGYEDGTFRPYNEMTRAETAVVISNYMKLLNGGTL